MNKNISYRPNRDMSNVYEWLSANKLTLNMMKTKFMLIASGRSYYNLWQVPLLL